MKKTILILIIVLLVLAIAVGGAALYFLNSPHYALMNIKKDVQAAGIDGLESHLTGNAEEAFDRITAITENPLATTIFSLLGKGEYLELLQAELDEITWNVEDIMTGKKNAQVVLAFDYQGKFTGTINISMVRTDSGWKIDGVNSPKIDGLNFEDLDLSIIEKFMSGQTEDSSDAEGSSGTEGFSFGDIQLPDMENFNFEDIQLPDFENFNFEDIQLPDFGIFNRGDDAST